MVVSLTPIIPATSVAARSSDSRDVPLASSMPSSFPLSRCVCRGLWGLSVPDQTYLYPKLISFIGFYLTLVYFILLYRVQGNQDTRTYVSDGEAGGDPNEQAQGHPGRAIR